jgi:hypothetical protein
MSKGILVFARNNEEVDYVKQAYFLAKRVKQYLDLPTSIVTDSPGYLEKSFPDWKDVFDKVIKIVWTASDVADDSILSNADNHSIKLFNDGSITSKHLMWKNESRTLAYEASPYDETLVLDTDIVINNSLFLQSFNQNNNLLMYNSSYDIAGIDRGLEFTWVSETGVEFYWATCVFFRKTKTNKIFFDLVRHIQENWQHYSSVFQLSSSLYRNDYAFSIAVHIMNGYQSGDFVSPMPGVLYYTTDKSVLWQITDDSLFILLEKHTYSGEYTAFRIKGANVHVMNKFSLNRCLDEQ